jgi:hypothetical protein
LGALTVTSDAVDEARDESAATATPVLVEVGGPNATRMAFEALSRSGGGKVGMSGRYSFSDLAKRECRDDSGAVHHHTRAYMRDHAGELSRAARYRGRLAGGMMPFIRA